MKRSQTARQKDSSTISRCAAVPVNLEQATEVLEGLLQETQSLLQDELLIEDFAHDQWSRRPDGEVASEGQRSGASTKALYAEAPGRDFDESIQAVDHAIRELQLGLELLDAHGMDATGIDPAAALDWAPTATTGDASLDAVDRAIQELRRGLEEIDSVLLPQRQDSQC